MQYLVCRKSAFENFDFNGFSSPDRVKVYLCNDYFIARDTDLLLFDSNPLNFLPGEVLEEMR